jgi:hypothetical protein
LNLENRDILFTFKKDIIKKYLISETGTVDEASNPCYPGERSGGLQFQDSLCEWGRAHMSCQLHEEANRRIKV